MKSGSWVGDKTGGCRNYDTFTNNPQFIVNLDEDDDGDGKSSCLIALMQKNRRKQKTLGVQELCIGFSVYKVFFSVYYFLCVRACVRVCQCMARDLNVLVFRLHQMAAMY